MTRAYAKLSLRAGVLAGGIDAALGTTEAREFLGPHKWDLTEELLDEVKRRALDRGVKPKTLALIEEYAARLCSNAELIDQGMNDQALRDAAGIR